MFAWHVHKRLFAIAHQTDLVYLYDMHAQGRLKRLGLGAGTGGTTSNARIEWWPSPLVHEKQKKVAAMAWQPMAMDTLAVACE